MNLHRVIILAAFLSVAGGALAEAPKPEPGFLATAFGRAADFSPVYPTQHFPSENNEVMVIFRLPGGHSFKKVTGVWNKLEGSADAPTVRDLGRRDNVLPPGSDRGWFTNRVSAPGRYRFDLLADGTLWRTAEFTVLPPATSPPPFVPQDLFPLIKGAEWHYEVRVQAAPGVDLSIQGIAPEPDGSLRMLTRSLLERIGPKGALLGAYVGDKRLPSAGSLFLWSPIGLQELKEMMVLADMAGAPVPPPHVRLPLPLTAPRRWTYESKQAGEAYTATLWGPVPIEGPAGVKPGYVVLEDHKPQSTGSPGVGGYETIQQTLERQYQYGVGLVRESMVQAVRGRMRMRADKVLTKASIPSGGERAPMAAAPMKLQTASPSVVTPPAKAAPTSAPAPKAAPPAKTDAPVAAGMGILRLVIGPWLPPFDPNGGWWGVARAGDGPNKILKRVTDSPEQVLASGRYDVYWAQDSDNAGSPLLVASGIEVKADAVADVAVDSGVRLKLAAWVPPRDPRYGWWGLTRPGDKPAKRLIWTKGLDRLLAPPGSYDVYWVQDYDTLDAPFLVASKVEVKSGGPTDVILDSGFALKAAAWVPPRDPRYGWWGLTRPGDKPANRLIWTKQGTHLLAPPGVYDIYWVQDYDALDAPLLLASKVEIKAGALTPVIADSGVEIKVAAWVPARHKSYGWWGLTRPGDKPATRVVWTKQDTHLLAPPGVYDLYWVQDYDTSGAPLLLASKVEVKSGALATVPAASGLRLKLPAGTPPLDARYGWWGAVPRVPQLVRGRWDPFRPGRPGSQVPPHRTGGGAPHGPSVAAHGLAPPLVVPVLRRGDARAMARRDQVGAATRPRARAPGALRGPSRQAQALLRRGDGAHRPGGQPPERTHGQAPPQDRVRASVAPGRPRRRVGLSRVPPARARGGHLDRPASHLHGARAHGAPSHRALQARPGGCHCRRRQGGARGRHVAAEPRTRPRNRPEDAPRRSAQG